MEWEPMMDRLKALGTRLFPASRRRDNHRCWQDRWNRPGDVSAWMNRGVSKEIEAAVNDGWFNRAASPWTSDAERGEVAYWLAQYGFHVVGVDIAPAAIPACAKAKHPDMVDKLDFWAHDLCGGPLSLHNVHCFVDRGCFHQVPPAMSVPTSVISSPSPCPTLAVR